MDNDTAVAALLEMSHQLMPNQSDENRKRSVRHALHCLMTDEHHHEDFVLQVWKASSIAAAVDRAFS